MYRITRSTVGGATAYVLSSGRGEEAVVLARGGTVRDLALAPPGGKARRVLERCEPERIADDPLFRGRLLFPFNDRIPGGRYVFGGVVHELRLNSPEDGSAIHGFLYRRTMEAVGESEEAALARLVLRDRIRRGDEPGYPFSVSLRVEYELSPSRFSLRFSMRNEGEGAAPIALGWHPYFTLGGRADDYVLSHRGEAFVPVGADLLPSGEPASVAGSPFDFRAGRRIGTGPLDIALSASSDGRLSLRGPAGPALVIDADPTLFRYTQLFVPPDRSSLAVEPVTAATDSFNRPGLGLLVLEPGEGRSGSVVLRVE